MDRNTIIGFVLIGLVLMIWLWLNAPPPQAAIPPAGDTAAVGQTKEIKTPVKQEQPKSEVKSDTLGKYFSQMKSSPERFIQVETDHYIAEITTVGAGVKKLILKSYDTWDQHPINLLNTTTSGDFNLMFFTSDGKLINTKNFVFQPERSDPAKITGGDSLKINLILQVTKTGRIVKTITFYGNLYSFDISYRFENMQEIISNFSYQMVWESGIRYVEQNSVDESNFAKAFAYVGGELTEVDATNFNETVSDSNISGKVDWLAVRNKYFAIAIIPKMKQTKRGYIEGTRHKLPDEGAKEDYKMVFEMPYSQNAVEADRFTVFAGPLDWDYIEYYNVGLEKMVSLGAAWIIRPISEYVIIPVFRFLKMFIPNYGVVLIIFSLLIKIVLHPLTKSSMKSMQRMQALQPMMTEIREKHKDDPQKTNQQIMRLYKEYGVNPAGGCLPLLLQLPILYALWAVFSSAIELRKASFIWWIQDLSAPDIIYKLPFKIPVFNIDEISGLALLMGITMFVQQKMSVKDPRQKMMVWMMPVLMTLMFNSFPSGLNLYYFVFNLLSIGQQAWINKQHKDEPLRKVEVKKSSGGFINRIAKDLPTRPKR